MPIFYSDSGSFKDLVVSGSTSLSGAVYLPSIGTGNRPNILSIDTTSGQLYFATTSSFTASWANSSSQAITASYITGSIFTNINPSLSASYASSSTSASFASTAANAGTLANALTQGTGISGFSYNGGPGQTVAISSSNLTIDRILKWTGTAFTTSSLSDNGTVINGNSSIQLIGASSILTGSFTGSFTGRLTGTSSWAESASNAINANTASQVENGRANYHTLWQTDTRLTSSRHIIESATGIGIGKTTPSTLLDINGNATITGSLTTSGSTQILIGTTQIVGNTTITGSTILSGSNQTLIGTTQVIGATTVTGSLTASGSSHLIRGNTTITGSTSLSGSVNIVGIAQTSQANFLAYNTDGTVTYASTSSFTAATASNVQGGANNYVALWTGSTQLTSSVIYQTGGNIGIGKITPNTLLDINGNTTITGSLISSGSNQTLIGTTRITGNTTITGSTTISSSLTTIGNTTITGSLTASGSNQTLIGTTQVIGNTTITGSLTSSGSNQILIGITQIVGATTITGSTTISSSLTTIGNTTITGSLTASGSSHLIRGNTTITGSLISSGSNQTLIGTTQVIGATTITGSTIISSSLTTIGATTITGSLTASGSNHLIRGNTTVTGSTSLSGSVNIVGIAQTSQANFLTYNTDGTVTYASTSSFTAATASNVENGRARYMTLWESATRLTSSGLLYETGSTIAILAPGTTTTEIGYTLNKGNLVLAGSSSGENILRFQQQTGTSYSNNWGKIIFSRGSSTTSYASIESSGYGDNDSGGTDQMNLMFRTAFGSNQEERLRITNKGLVGIGRSGSRVDAQLHISKSAAAATTTLALKVEGNIQTTGSTILSGSLELDGIANTNQANFLTYNSTTGNVTYTSTSSIVPTNSVTSSYPIAVTGSTLYSTSPPASNTWNATNTVGNIFLGDGAGTLATNVNNAIFLGKSTGNQATNAIASVFIGATAGDQATHASQSVFIGASAGAGLKSGSYSICIGDSAGYVPVANSIVSQSIFIGPRAGYDSANIGNNNIIIGTNISVPANRSNMINIGGVIFATGSYSTITGTPSTSSQDPTVGRVGIGTNTPSTTLHVSGTVTITGTSSSFVAPAPPRVTKTSSNTVVVSGSARYAIAGNTGASPSLLTAKSGTVIVMVSGYYFNNLPAGGTSNPPLLSLVYNNTTPPTTPATVAHNTLATFYGGSSSGSVVTPYTMTAMLEGSIANTYWFDVTITAGGLANLTSSISSTKIVAFEI